MEEDNVEYIKTIFYEGMEGAETVEVIVSDNTFWATQKSMSQLFDVDRTVISKHLKNIFKEEELFENSVVSKMEITGSDGEKYKTKLYNLDAMISVGYRVNSKKAIQFRQWFIKLLKEYMIKGFLLDEDLLKNGERFPEEYFDELIEKINEIRSSERKVYQKLTDLFKECSYDYNLNSKITKEFYTKVYNKFHQEGISENYLTQEELEELNILLDKYLDYAENQARKHNVFTMKEWAEKLNPFLDFKDS